MNTTTLGKSGPAGHAGSDADAVYGKVAWRLLPLLFLCYIAAYLDRVNVGFAKLGMQADLHLSDAIYGLGAGIFFVGYFIFEVPSNIILHKVGAGRWIARIMVSWGVISAGTMFVNSVTSFYVARFLLGVAEAGFFPGIILYLTYWFPAERRGRATSLFLTAVAVAGIIGGPVSGWILHSLGGVNGWQGWQWLFLLEAIPSLVLGVVAMYLVARSADRLREARWHTAVMCAVGAVGLIISVTANGNVPVSMTGLTLCTIGIMSALPVSWSTPTSLLGGAAAAAGIAMINSIGNLAGFVIPFAIGAIKDATHSTDLGLYMLAALMLLGGLIELALPKRGMH